MSAATETRWPIGKIMLGLGMPLFILGLSMDWYGGAGVGLGEVLTGADREVMARIVGIVGYLACAPAFLVFLEVGAVDGSRPHVVVDAGWFALIPTVISFLGGLVLATGARHDDAMEPGFLLFCCGAVCMMIGLLASLPKARERRPRVYPGDTETAP